MLLAPFLVVVETVRSFIRFLTLALRLTANLTVGHVILSALGVYIIYGFLSSPINYFGIIALLFRIGYIVFEFGVAILQAYIFFLLSCLYTNDHPLALYISKCILHLELWPLKIGTSLVYSKILS